MMRFKAPAKNQDFEPKVAAEREKVRRAIERGEQPKIDNALWREFKADFSGAQRGRCGYCEISVIAGQHGDVEHYAPKNALMEFGPNPEAEEGIETPNLAKLEGRSPSKRWPAGYWWLAYDWSNYLLACEVCNSVWKGNLFPVRQPPARQAPPAENGGAEVPLLLTPFGSRDPARHLVFNADGSVEPRNGSPFGRETIRTCGLRRQALVKERRYAAENAFAAVVEARRAAANGIPPENNQGLRDLHRMGAEDAYFPGMVRAIILQQLGPLTWSHLNLLFKQS
jgi:hypothetical protein